VDSLARLGVFRASTVLGVLGIECAKPVNIGCTSFGKGLNKQWNSAMKTDLKHSINGRRLFQNSRGRIIKLN
jgi:hypothetical protein